MEAAKSKFAVKFLPSLADFAFLIPLIFLFGRMDGVKTLLGDCDTGWHIRTGQWILAHHQAPAHDFFSFSKPGQPWFAWEWLTDVIFAGLFAAGGLNGVVLFALLLIATTFTALYFLVRRQSNPVIAILITMVASAAASIHWLARPHLFTLLFVVFFYAALEQVRAGRRDVAGLPILVLLPVITMVWANLHAGFFVGTLMIGVYAIGELIPVVLSTNRGEWQPAWRKARAYLLSAAAGMALSLINPYTYHLHTHVTGYLRNPWSADHINEYLSPNFHHPTAIFFELMLALGVMAAIHHVRSRRYNEAILIVVWAHGALLAVRNIPIFMIVAAPPVASTIHQWLLALPGSNAAAWLGDAGTRINRILRETAETDAMPRFHLVSILAATLVVAVILAPNPPGKFRAEFDPKNYPAAALATLRQDPNARIFTNDEWGDYLIYRLYPEYRVFVDGRDDFYGVEFERKYVDALDAKYGWQQTLDRFRIDTILLPLNTPLTGALKESSKWRVVYDDGQALVFRPAIRQDEQESARATARGGETVIARSRKPQTRDRHVITEKPIEEQTQ